MTGARERVKSEKGRLRERSETDTRKCERRSCEGQVSEGARVFCKSWVTDARRILG